jgi:hypothetical protein
MKSDAAAAVQSERSVSNTTHSPAGVRPHNSYAHSAIRENRQECDSQRASCRKQDVIVITRHSRTLGINSQVGTLQR